MPHRRRRWCGVTDAHSFSISAILVMFLKKDDRYFLAKLTSNPPHASPPKSDPVSYITKQTLLVHSLTTRLS